MSDDWARRQQHRRARIGALAERCREIDGRVAGLRVFVFLGALVLLGLSGLETSWSLAARGAGLVLVVVFAILIVRHRAIGRSTRRLNEMEGVVDRELLRVEGKLAELPSVTVEDESGTGSDLALLGDWSLMRVLSRCATPFGAEHLKKLLLTPDPATVRERQEAVWDLKGRRAFRQRFEAEGRRGVEDGPEPAALIAALETSSIHERHPWLVHVARALVVLTWVGIAWAWLEGPTALALGGLLAQLGIFAWSDKQVGDEVNDLLPFELSLSSWAGMLALLEKQRFDAERLREVQAALVRDGRPSSAALARLSELLSPLQSRFGMMHPVLGVLLAWDLHSSHRLWRFRKDWAGGLREVFRALGEMEALSSLAAHADSFAEPCRPVLAADGPPLKAERLNHPLLDRARAVANDVELSEEQPLLLLTGSNMSGKSTLLRSVGLNAVLALAGGAVHAARFELRPCRIESSIHVSDALDEGVSLFHAEVRRLHELVTAIAESDRESSRLPVLFLIDEVLRGTNTRERTQASAALLRRLAQSRSFGVVTSHEIALTELETELPRLVNAHFSEQVEDGEMTFDYQLRSGPVQSTNALEVLRLFGLDAELDLNG
ncbi:MAG: hypothetical protein AAF533_23780 [Acidobacteriota bacterium]